MLAHLFHALFITHVLDPRRTFQSRAPLPEERTSPAKGIVICPFRERQSLTSRAWSILMTRKAEPHSVGSNRQRLAQK